MKWVLIDLKKQKKSIDGASEVVVNLGRVANYFFMFTEKLISVTYITFRRYTFF